MIGYNFKRHTRLANYYLFVDNTLRPDGSLRRGQFKMEKARIYIKSSRHLLISNDHASGIPLDNVILYIELPFGLPDDVSFSIDASAEPVFFSKELSGKISSIF